MRMKFLITAILATSLGACVSVLPDSGDQPPRLRLYADVPTDKMARRPVDAGLVIHDPTTEAVYNTFHVAVATGPYRFEYVDGAQWTDRIPALFRIYLKRRFENTNTFRAVGDPTELTRGAEYNLYTDLRAFHIDRASSEERAVVSYGTRLVNRRGETLGSRVFSATSPTGEGDVDRYAEALDMAARQTSSETIDWASALIRTDMESRP